MNGTGAPPSAIPDCQTGPTRYPPWQSLPWPLLWAAFWDYKRRVAASFGIALAGIVWLVVYAVFLAQRFPWYDNLAVIGLTLFAIPAAIVGIWIAFGIKLHRRLGIIGHER